VKNLDKSVKQMIYPDSYFKSKKHILQSESAFFQSHLDFKYDFS